jgi:hypothetical protein
MQHTKHKEHLLIEDAKFEELPTASSAGTLQPQSEIKPAPSRVVRSMRVVVDKVPSVRLLDAVELVMLCAYMAAKVVALLGLWLLMLVFKILGLVLSTIESRLPWAASPDADYQTESKPSPTITVINNTNIHVGSNE